MPPSEHCLMCRKALDASDEAEEIGKAILDALKRETLVEIRITPSAVTAQDQAPLHVVGSTSPHDRTPAGVLQALWDVAAP